MKAQILDTTGKKIKEITTNLFEEPIREDIIKKVVETEKIWQPYSIKFEAGMNRSASGNIRHTRHSWKSDRGKGLSRIPRKVFWRRGTQFSWEGAIVPNVKGGRRAHPPKSKVNLKKINKKELKKALLSALTLISKENELKKKYNSLKDKKINIELPIIIDNKILSLKTREFLASLKKILKEFNSIAIQKKSIRAGKGKLRGRKYKSNAGLLLIVGKEENKKLKGIDVVKSNQLIVSDLASNGARLSIFTENAIKDLEKSLIGNKEKQPKTLKKSSKNKSGSSDKIQADTKINKEQIKKQ